MRCSLAVALPLLFATGAACAADMRLGTGLLLVEPGQAAPVIDLRDTAANGNAWGLGISGWTLSGSIERPVERGRRVFLSAALTPYNAHSSRRRYRDGARARDLEYDSGSYLLRGGMRVRAGEHHTTEIAAVVGREVIGDDAPAAIRRAWRSPYAGFTWLQRYRRVAADDPLAGRIHGVEMSSLVEMYAGNRLWSRLTLTETAGRPVGRIQLRQTAMLFEGSGLDRVSAFPIGGSWDVLGASAVYGSHYAEYFPSRGIVINGGADYVFARSWEAGARISAFRSRSVMRKGAALQTTVRLGGLRVTTGVAVAIGPGERHTIVYAALSAAAFER
ncbi:MAG: hypothetical protein QOK37_1954 [Thermoanaerobaculia bacterium]|jgi:hypothetical protein|nr:hypothetical protein [Thermoanaerobaculia bacterium]